MTAEPETENLSTGLRAFELSVIKNSVRAILKSQPNSRDKGNFRRAAIIVYTGFKELKEISLSVQVEACNTFIERQGWIVSDLYFEKNNKESIDFLARARAWSGQFDYVVSYVNFAHVSMGDDQDIGGIIACLDAESYAKGLVNAW
jgi:hypothetical protein